MQETASPITDRHGAVTGAVAVLRDVTEAVAMQARMAHLAQYDALTDLPNRLLLQDRAQLAIAHARRDGRSLAVMYIDLDGFKGVNDRLGHDMGDRLLVQFAQRLKGAVRESDTVCRQGGDEFVVLLPGLEDVEGACSVARKILATASTPSTSAASPVRRPQWRHRRVSSAWQHIRSAHSARRRRHVHRQAQRARSSCCTRALGPSRG